MRPALLCRLTLAAFLALAAAPSLLAADRALVLTLPDKMTPAERNALRTDHGSLVTAYRAAGYRVSEAFNPDNASLRKLVSDIEAALPDTDRLVIHLSGLTVSIGDGSAMLLQGSALGSRADVTLTSVPLSLFFDIAADRPDASMVALATPPEPPVPTRAYANASHVYNVPAGVLVLRGAPANVRDVVIDRMLGRGQSAREIPDIASGVRFEGAVTGGLRLAVPSAAQPPRPPLTDAVEEALWALASQSREREVVQAYLDRYPRGKYAAEARRILDEANRPPTPEEIEAALNLNRDARRRIQQDLTVLGFDTRGVDGIFGGGTRAAIGRWQDRERYDRTGYLDGEQIRRLADQARAREAELRAEEERRKRIEEAADRAYWRETGISGEERDLRRYLERYPNGLFAAQARQELAEYNRIASQEAWFRARNDDTIDGYRRFLDAYPDSPFSAAARARLAALEDAAGAGARAEAERVERSLGLNPATLLLMEQRLRFLGYDPGAIDGRIDANTRRAIAEFQRNQGLDSTGYVNQPTVSQLIFAR